MDRVRSADTLPLLGRKPTDWKLGGEGSLCSGLHQSSGIFHLAEFREGRECGLDSNSIDSCCSYQILGGVLE